MYNSQLQSLAHDLTSRSNAIMAALEKIIQPQASGALGLASLGQIQPLYESSKSYMCCDVPGLAARLWIILTVLGWLGLALGVAGMLILHQLDQAHGSGACCSCAWLRPARLPVVGKPVDVMTLRDDMKPTDIEMSKGEVKIQLVD